MTGEARDESNVEQAEDQQPLAQLIEARLDLLAAAYPALVADESRELIRGEIGNAIARDARLRHYRLGNDDGPMGGFRPYRAAEPEGKG